MQLNSFQGSKHPGGRPRGHGVSWYLARIGDEVLPTGKTKKEHLATRLFEIVLDPETSTKDVISLSGEIMDRLEGKPVATNLNIEEAQNPFEGIDTKKIEELKLKLLDLEITKEGNAAAVEQESS